MWADLHSSPHRGRLPVLDCIGCGAPKRRVKSDPTVGDNVVPTCGAIRWTRITHSMGAGSGG